MNQPDNRQVGVPGGGRPVVAPSADPGRSGATTGMPGADPQGPEAERLLAGVERDLASVDEKNTQEQVPVFDRIHTALADALARTADTGGSPSGGPQGA